MLQAMALLNPQQLTGRTREHVREWRDLQCTLHPEAARAFTALAQAAREAGLRLAVASGFRDFDRQLAIWNDKYSGRRPLLDRSGEPLDPGVMTAPEIVGAILHWSALPGASRHHWGTEIDVIDRAALAEGQQPQLIPAEYAAAGVFEPLDRWLSEHAESFGFFRPYDRDRGGVQPEPWHLSYAPISGAALASLSVEVLREALQGVELAGAAAVRPQLADIHARYVRAVAAPSKRALAAPRLAGSRISPATRPS
jgi:LAS superfamily LD-carboxypeptidase LdcB